jgi:hypothetical protein
VNPEELRALEPDFWRAPSAHNTQPWVLHYGDDAAEIGWDPRYAIPLSDPTGRDLRLSLGAFVECCLIVCADAGISVDFQPDYSHPHRRIGRLVPAAQTYATPFGTSDVHRRTTSRVTYEPHPLTDEAFAELRGLGAAEGSELRRVPCRELIRLLRDADRHQFDTPPVVRELREWLRLTPRHPNYRIDGLTDRTLALSRPEAFGLRTVLAAATYPLLRHAGLPRILAAASQGLLDHDGDVLILVAPPDCGPEGQVAIGRVLLRQWLTLSCHGYATHPLSQIIDCPHTRDNLAGLLEIDDAERLLNVARAGRPTAPTSRSARRKDSQQVGPVV